jgi:hypothetical protein
VFSKDEISFLLGIPLLMRGAIAYDRQATRPITAKQGSQSKRYPLQANKSKSRFFSPSKDSALKAPNDIILPFIKNEGECKWN